MTDTENHTMDPDRLEAVEQRLAALTREREAAHEHLAVPRAPKVRGWRAELLACQEEQRQIRAAAHREAESAHQTQLMRAQPRVAKLEKEIRELEAAAREESERHAAAVAKSAAALAAARRKVADLERPETTAESLLAKPDRQNALRAIDHRAALAMAPVGGTGHPGVPSRLTGGRG